MPKTNLLGFTAAQLEGLMLSLGERAFHGRQLFKWFYKLRQYDFSRITDLSRDLRTRLAEGYDFRGLTSEHTMLSQDGTRKFLFRLDDGLAIESVLIPEEVGRKTVCISSQVGCPLGCAFCATGKMGGGRNLTVGEIVGQLIFLRDQYGEDAFTNIVLMGMGEPLLNFDNVIEAVKIISAGDGLSVAAKKVTISTAGIIPVIRRLADMKLKVRLAVSLNAALQEKRLRIMPLAKKYPLGQLAEVLKYYTDVTRFRVTFEYILFAGFNDTMDDVMALSHLIRGIPCKINLLAYNPVEGLEFERPSEEAVDWFAKQLYPRAPAVTVRRSRGTDIDAACGQLAAKQRKRRQKDA
ncbi:MAG: 23S rRNA (adenine(2503)-C(2))-methyltransferase RlmN [Candidatus Zixiibacteriota bacterium]|nr:MAG: 23S rRNA (adenine(2503)-C(2))-methyltransferase RlmN [candidate division Zixibacteria bacterium]